MIIISLIIHISLDGLPGEIDGKKLIGIILKQERSLKPRLWKLPSVLEKSKGGILNT